MGWGLALGVPAATSIALVLGGLFVAIPLYHAVCLAALFLDRSWRSRIRRPSPGWTWISVALILGGLSAALLLPRPEQAEEILRERVFGGSLSRFWIFAAYSMLVRCPVEELFWRGVIDPRSATANGLGFYLQHALPLSIFLGSPVGALLSIPAGLAGAYWSFVTRREGSLLPALMSHAAADAMILGIVVTIAFSRTA